MPIGSVVDSLLLVTWFAVSAVFIAWVVSEWAHVRRPRRRHRGDRAL